MKDIPELQEGIMGKDEAMALNLGGRPHKFSPERVEKLLYAVRLGAPYELACKYAGMSYALLYNWMKWAKEGQQEYVDFMEQLERAEGDACVKWLKIIDNAAKDENWQPAAWKLERRHGKHYSNQSALIEFHERMKKMEEKLLKGEMKDAGEAKQVDSENAHEEGGAA